MITEGQYLDALKTVREYLKQIEEEVSKKPYNEFLDKLVVGYPGISVRLTNAIRAMYEYGYTDDGLMTRVPIKNVTFRYILENGIIWFRKRRHIGKKSIAEIQEIFKQNGFEFK